MFHLFFFSYFSIFFLSAFYDLFHIFCWSIKYSQRKNGWSETSMEDFIQDYYNIEQDYYKEEIELKSTKTNGRVLSAKMS